MTKDNVFLGKFDLTGIKPSPRGVPQIEVKFQVDVNGILQVSAVDKTSGNTEQITITADQGRLSPDEIEEMIRKAAENAEEDEKVKLRIDARNNLESFVYNLKNTLDDDSEGKSNISLEDKQELNNMMDEVLDSMDDNMEATKEEYMEKLKELENVANPILRKMYSSGDGYGEDDGYEFEDDEL